MKISEGKKIRPQKVVIYGPEGIGKTTLAAQFPDPLFLDLEDGSSTMDVRRVEDIGTWDTLLGVINEIYKDPGICKTLVIDTADKAENMAIKAVCEERGLKGIEDAGYGKGYTYLFEKMAYLLTGLDYLIRKGVNVVILAHAQMRKFEQPDELGAYDRWELKLSKKSAPLVKEWADIMLFCNYKTNVSISQDGKARASGGKRVMYTSHHACWDAKNRHGLKEQLNMDYNEIKHIFEED